VQKEIEKSVEVRDFKQADASKFMLTNLQDEILTAKNELDNFETSLVQIDAEINKNVSESAEVTRLQENLQTEIKHENQVFLGYRLKEIYDLIEGL